MVMMMLMGNILFSLWNSKGGPFILGETLGKCAKNPWDTRDCGCPMSLGTRDVSGWNSDALNMN